MITNINGQDLSPNKAGQIYREIQQLREDLNVNSNLIKDEIKQPKGNLNSPYAPDRAGTQHILGTDQETQWRRRLDIMY
jgi:hypothetical protein